MSGSLFADPADARFFISLIHESTGLFANVQRPSLGRVGTTGVIDEQSCSFHETSDVERQTVVSPKRDYVLCSAGVRVNGNPQFADSSVDLAAGIAFSGVGRSAVVVLHEATYKTHYSLPASGSVGLSIIGLYECRSFAALWTRDPFEASIRIHVDAAMGWNHQTSSGYWKTFRGSLVSPVLKLATDSAESFLLPWNLPPSAQDETPLRTPSPKTVWIELVELEEAQHDFTVQGDPGHIIPERSPSPKARWIELEEMGQTEDGFVPKAVPDPPQRWIDLVELENAEEGQVPERSPSPKSRWIELEEMGLTEDNFAPEAVPDPPQSWIDLVELGDTDEGRVPEVNPHPTQLWVELALDTGDLSPPVVPVSLTLVEDQESGPEEWVIENEVDLQISTMLEDLAALGIPLKTQLDRWENISSIDLAPAIETIRLALIHTPDSHPRKRVYVTQMSLALAQTKELLDGYTAIVNLEILRATKPDEDVHRSGFCSVLPVGDAHFNRFRLLGQSLSLDACISARRTAVDVMPKRYRSRPELLSSLGDALATRFIYFGDSADLADSVTIHQTALNMTPDGHPHQPTCLSGLGSALALHANHFQSFNGRDLSIDLLQRAVSMTPNNHPAMSRNLFNLSKGLAMRFKQLNNMSDLDAAIQTAHQTAELGGGSDHGYFSHLGDVYIMRLERLGDALYLPAPINATGEAVYSTFAGHPIMTPGSRDRSESQSLRFEYSADVAGLFECASMQRMAFHSITDDHLDKPRYTFNLSLVAAMQFRCEGDLFEINQAISFGRLAIELTPTDHPNMPKYLFGLAKSFALRFERQRDVSDLVSAIDMGRSVLELTHDGHPAKPRYLSGLGTFLVLRFGHLGSVSDLDDAISAGRSAVDSAPDGHPEYPQYLSRLAHSLTERFNLSGDVSDLDTAIIMRRTALDSAPDDDPNARKYLSDLNAALAMRSEYVEGPRI